ncbi:protein that enables flagellar motor rotation [Georgfuchsia toluolica]|uniref:Protein that enables flagellar motor rotation n=1 Tax=Georgfuchsia toluolica TaxID=424218 RepID=A0A916NGG3_9PROT|nr:flagellar motor protein MotB [Georgfuchsia toluolica]CAG4882157.1 protein that enables flagellar motor rotation [Georgfuchsia toluolica]
MAEIAQRPIVIRRSRRKEYGHHVGAWKIAYADFVTAMMAFFLLMWLLGSTTKGQLEGIAEYFKNPLQVGLAGGSGSGDSSSIIHGGGKDLTRREGQINQGEVDSKKRTVNLKAAEAELQQIETARLKALKAHMEAAIDASAMLRQFKNQLLLDITREGLRIQIIDEKSRPMFAMGSSDLQPYTREILHEIGKMLNDVPNKIALSGHTDATPYPGGAKGYSNWELSSDRANACRRELIKGGMDDGKIVRVVGLSSAVLLNKTDPLNPMNRRISIVVMNKQTEDSLNKQAGEFNVSSADDISDG